MSLIRREMTSRRYALRDGDEPAGCRGRPVPTRVPGLARACEHARLTGILIPPFRRDVAAPWAAASRKGW